MESDPVPGEVSGGRFRELMSNFATSVSVVTALDGDGRPQGMTCSSLASVCLDPPTLLVCLRTGSPTLAAALAGQEFAVNLLHAGARSAAELFAARVPDRFAEVRWKPSRRGLPWLLDEACASADYRVAGRIPVGDHTVVFGELLDARIDDRSNPLVYGKRQYTAWQQIALPG